MDRQRAISDITIIWARDEEDRGAYSYEGTKQINGLIVGRAVTGFSAFV